MLTADEAWSLVVTPQGPRFVWPEDVKEVAGCVKFPTREAFINFVPFQVLMQLRCLTGRVSPEDIWLELERRPDVAKPAKTTKKAAAPAKVAKPTKPKVAAKPEAEKRTNVRTPMGAIIFLTDKKPTRKRDAALKRFALYKNGQTVEQYIKAGGIKWDVWYDNKAGFIRLENPPKAA